MSDSFNILHDFLNKYLKWIFNKILYPIKVMENSSRLLLQENKKTLNNNAKCLVEKGLPMNIVNLDTALEEFHSQSLCDVHQELEIIIPETIPKKKPRLHYYHDEDEPKPPLSFTCVNNAVQHTIGIVKPYIEQLTNDANLLKMWIASLPPNAAEKSEVQTIKCTLKNDIHQTCDHLMEMIWVYSKNRDDIVKSIRRQTPKAEALKTALKDIDENMYLSMRSALVDIRNHYSVLDGLLTYNFDKIMTAVDPEWMKPSVSISLDS